MLLSIIIPIYKVEKYIVDCIESIVVQLRPEHSVEIICVNDGTPDRSMDILKQYLSGLDTHIQNRFKLINQENNGLSGARNTGLEVSTGKYVTFIDSDDKVLDSYINEIYTQILSADFDLLDFNILDSHGNLIKTCGNSIGVNRLNDVFKTSNWFAWARVYSREILDNERFILGIYYEDLAFVPNIYLKAKKIIHLEKELYWYRSNPEGITKKISVATNLKTINSFEIILKNYIDMNKSCGSKYFNFLIFHCYFMLCFYSCQRSGWKTAMHYLKMYKAYHICGSDEVFDELLGSSTKLFFNHPKIYILAYFLYVSAKKSISR